MFLLSYCRPLLSLLSLVCHRICNAYTVPTGKKGYPPVLNAPLYVMGSSDAQEGVKYFHFLYGDHEEAMRDPFITGIVLILSKELLNMEQSVNSFPETNCLMGVRGKTLILGEDWCFALVIKKRSASSLFEQHVLLVGLDQSNSTWHLHLCIPVDLARLSLFWLGLAWLNWLGLA